MLAVSFLKKQFLGIILQVSCFATCFVLCAMFMFYTDSKNIVPQHTPAVKNDENKKSVILDAGHGGEDSGAVGIDGVLEKELNLSVCLRLQDLLQCAGFDVVPTRTEDVMLGNGEAGHKKMADLQARVEMGNENPNAYFVSIHMNKFPKEYCKGVQLFYSPNHTGSLPIANSLHTLVKNHLQPDNPREVKNGAQHIYLMNRIQNPAILVECGFVSNENEAKLLQNSDYQKKLALVILAALNEARAASFVS